MTPKDISAVVRNQIIQIHDMIPDEPSFLDLMAIVGMLEQTKVTIAGTAPQVALAEKQKAEKQKAEKTDDAVEVQVEVEDAPSSNVAGSDGR